MKFVKRHYPNDVRWQLLDNPYSEEDFLNSDVKVLQPDYQLPVKGIIKK